MIVSVYRNLKYGRSTPPLYSIMHKGRVVARRHRVLLSNARFVVREAGRKRVLKEKRKNVHAFVVGELVDERGIFGIDANGKDLPVKVTYNPYKSDCFESNHGCVQRARGVLLNEHGITACYLE